MTTLKEYAGGLIAYKFITSITGRISDRAKRVYERLGKEASERLKEKEKLPEKSDLILRLKWSDEAVAWQRKITLALEEFKQVNPEAYEQFEKIREKHKAVRRAYLEFGGEIQDEIYVGAIKGVIKGITDRDAIAFFNRLKVTNKVLGKDEEGLQKLLLPE